MTSIINPREPLDPAMIIFKKLTKTDLANNLKLPKLQIESVLTKMDGVTVDSLKIGREVAVYDSLEGDEYKVILKCCNKGEKYHFGEGWSTMKHSLELEEGQELKLYWHHGHKKFILLNFPYTFAAV